MQHRRRKMNLPPTFSALPLDALSGHDLEPLYTTTVRVTSSDAREGRVAGTARSDDGSLQLQLRLRNTSDGPGSGTNPEQLLAASYAACIHRTLNLLAADTDIDMENVVIEVSVASGLNEADGLSRLSANVQIEMPGIADDVAEELLTSAERLCPYSRMARQGMAISIVRSVPDGSKERVREAVHTGAGSSTSGEDHKHVDG
jgi:Ohr subfamily peroxiredoxin